MSNWTHSICKTCWEKKTAAEGNPDRIPVTVRNDSDKPCCFCAEPTMAGIYVRHDPAQLKCSHPES